MNYMILLAFHYFLNFTKMHDNPVLMCVTHSSSWATGVCSVVRAACVVGGLTHGAYRPFLLLTRRHFGDRSKQNTQSMSKSYRQIIGQKYILSIWPREKEENSSEAQNLCYNEISTWACIKPITPTMSLQIQTQLANNFKWSAMSAWHTDTQQLQQWVTSGYLSKANVFLKQKLKVQYVQCMCHRIEHLVK